LSQPNRPTEKELYNKLKGALSLLNVREGLFVDPGKAVGELNALGIGDSMEVWPLIRELLLEITPSNYTGGRPPHKSYEKAIEGKELFAFSWDSSRLGKKMYLKYAIKDDRFYYVSLHDNRPPS
jgi:hypothetical protein